MVKDKFQELHLDNERTVFKLIGNSESMVSVEMCWVSYGTEFNMIVTSKFPMGCALCEITTNVALTGWTWYSLMCNMRQFEVVDLCTKTIPAHLQFSSNG